MPRFLNGIETNKRYIKILNFLLLKYIFMGLVTSLSQEYYI